MYRLFFTALAIPKNIDENTTAWLELMYARDHKTVRMSQNKKLLFILFYKS